MSLYKLNVVEWPWNDFVISFARTATNTHSLIKELCDFSEVFKEVQSPPSWSLSNGRKPHTALPHEAGIVFNNAVSVDAIRIGLKWFWFLFMEGGRTVLTWLPLGWNFMDLLWSLFSPFTLCIRGLSILLSLISPPPFSALFVLSQTSKCKGDCDVDVFLCSHLWSLVLSRSSKYALIRINLFKHVWPNGRLSFAFWKVKLVNSYTSGHHLSGRQATN